MCLMLFGILHFGNEHTHATRVTAGLDLFFSDKDVVKPVNLSRAQKEQYPKLCVLIQQH